MTSPLESLFAAKTAEEIVSELSIRIYEPPLSELRDRVIELPPAIRIPMLILDFDTEVNMQGILGFLENATGLFLNETIDAFNEIGAVQTASVLTEIRGIMEHHGVTPEDLRADFEEAVPHQITSFQELHGPDQSAMASEVDQAADALYIYADDSENIWELLATFVANNKTELISIIRNAE